MDEDIIKKTVETLENGGTILYPTDTIWGIGCDATNSNAVDNIYSIKKRPEKQSMLILVNSVEMIKDYVENIPDIALQLIDISKSPLTIVYPKGKNLAENLLGSDGSIGIRITMDDFCNELISEFKKPIVSTSANTAGTNSPLVFFDISENIKRAVDYIVPIKHNEFSPRKSSDIIKVKSNGEINIIR